VLATEEGQNIAKALGSNKAALLQNHGILTVGQTIEETVFWFVSMEKCCHAQLLADAAAAGRGGETVKIGEEEAVFTYNTVGTPLAGWFRYVGLISVLVRSLLTEMVVRSPCSTLFIRRRVGIIWSRLLRLPSPRKLSSMLGQYLLFRDGTLGISSVFESDSHLHLWAVSGVSHLSFCMLASLPIWKDGKMSRLLCLISSGLANHSPDAVLTSSLLVRGYASDISLSSRKYKAIIPENVAIE